MQNRETQTLSSNSSSKIATEKGGNVNFFEFQSELKKCFRFKNSLFKFIFYASICTSCIGKMPPPEEKMCLCKDVLTENKIHCNLYS